MLEQSFTWWNNVVSFMFYFHYISNEFLLYASVLPSAPSFICYIFLISHMLETVKKFFCVIFHHRLSGRKKEIAAERMFYWDWWGWAASIYIWIIKKTDYFPALVSFFFCCCYILIWNHADFLLFELWFIIFFFLVFWSKSKTIKPQVKTKKENIWG